LTVEQAWTLLGKWSLKYIRESMKELANNKYLQRVYAYRNSPSGSTPGIFYLANEGIRYLEEDDIEVFEHRARLSRNKQRKPKPSIHTLAVNDFLIAARLLEKDYPDLHLIEFRHEWEFKRSPIPVRPLRIRGDVLKEEAMHLCPDAWLYFRKGVRRKRVCVFLEVDLNTENARQIKRKIAAYRELVRKRWNKEEKRFVSVYETLFSDTAVLIAFPTTSERQRETLREWARSELKATKEPGWLCELFVFAAIPHKLDEKTGQPLDSLCIEHNHVYFDRIWYTPFGKAPKEPFSLLSNLVS